MVLLAVLIIRTQDREEIQNSEDLHSIPSDKTVDSQNLWHLRYKCERCLVMSVMFRSWHKDADVDGNCAL
jgi:hypothetical protein